MIYLRILKNAVGARWLSLPGSILSFCLFLTAAAKAFGLDWFPVLSVKTFALGGLFSVLVWFAVGITTACVSLTKKLEALQNAWDRTDAHLIPISEAMAHIIKYDPAYHKIPNDNQIHLAAVKARSLGWENKIAFWGRFVHQDEDGEVEIVDEHFVQLSPTIWKTCMLDEASLDLEDINMRGRTVEDPNYGREIKIPDVYCDIKVSKNTLQAMFPAK